MTQRQTSFKVLAEDNPGVVIGFVTPNDKGGFDGYSSDADETLADVSSEEALEFVHRKRKEHLGQGKIGGMHQRGNRHSRGRRHYGGF